MNKILKITAVIAAIAVAVGACLMIIGYSFGGARPMYIDNDGIHVGGISGKLVSKFEQVGKFENISIDVDTVSVSLKEGDEFAVQIKAPKEDSRIEVEIEDTTLAISEKETWRDRKWFNFGFGAFNNDDWDRECVITYPKGTVIGIVDIYSDVGEVTIDGLRADSLSCSLNVGDMSIKNSEVKYSSVELDVGELTSKKFISDGIEIDTNIGDIELNGTFRGEISISSDIGAVTFKTTLTEDQYNCELSSDLGETTVNGRDVKSGYRSYTNASNNLEIESNIGEVEAQFGGIV